MSRLSSARKSSDEAVSGRSKLTLAKLIVFTETVLRAFARPLFFAGIFAALAWLGVFSKLYPYAHLMALAGFVLLFFDALGKASAMWKSPTSSDAKRRVEEASGLRHRPLDVLEDRPFAATDDTHSLWQAHVAKAREQAKHLRWPHFKIDFSKHDPHRLRYVFAVLLAFGLIAGWGALGSRMIAAINPALGKLPLATVTIDAWITPPAYTHLSPIMIATPAGNRFQDEVIAVPEGSVLHAHLAEKDGDTPLLEANNQSTEFSAKDGKDFDVTETLTGGDAVAIRRGWMTLGAWKVHVVADTAPEISFSETPTPSERKSMRLAYDAKDDYGVTSVTLRLTPRASMPGISGDAVDFPLASTDTKALHRVDFKDLTAEPWAGTLVDLQLIATDAVGHKTASGKVSVTLPEREFFQPVARALINERKKLLRNIADLQAQSETANLMAGLAHQPASFGNDPVVMMALRAGAVRLVLDHDDAAALAVKDILWQTATRIEDGMVGMAEQNLKQAQQELADALDHNASESEIQSKINRLHQALAQYLAQLSTRMAAHPTAANDLGKLMGSRTNVLTPQDLEKMMDQMRSLSASGSLDKARQELSRLQQILESMKTDAPKLTEEQKASLELLKNLDALKQDQQKLLDTTFQKAQSGGHDKNSQDQSSQGQSSLAGAQAALHARLQGLMDKAKDIKGLKHGADAMLRAEMVLKQNKLDTAAADQNEALKALQDAEQSVSDTLQQNAFAIPQAGSGSEHDPFGREDGSSFTNDTSGIHLPDRMEAKHVRDILNEIQHRAGDLTRPKTERDYIERLLQNF